MDTLSSYPIELRLRILHFLDVDSIVQVMYLSREWCVLANDSVLWRTIFLSRFGSSEKFDEIMKKFHRIGGEETKGSTYSALYTDCAAREKFNIPDLVPQRSFADLRNKHVSRVPKAFFTTYRYCNYLLLSHNNLTEIPEAIRDLPHLSHLLLDNNRITSFREDLGPLPKLTELCITDNQISTLPVDLITDMAMRKVRNVVLRFCRNPLNLETCNKLSVLKEAQQNRKPKPVRRPLTFTPFR